jgi:hypothetical protein
MPICDGTSVFQASQARDTKQQHPSLTGCLSANSGQNSC